MQQLVPGWLCLPAKESYGPRTENTAVGHDAARVGQSLQVACIDCCDGSQKRSRLGTVDTS